MEQLAILFLCACYITPGNSCPGNISHEIYDVLTYNVYMYSETAPVFICGDLNARIGAKQDIDSDSYPYLPARKPID